MVKMNEGCKTELYVDFGVSKMCLNYNLYQRCMIQNILRSCWLSLSDLIPSEKEEHIERALIHTAEMERILSGMEPWIASTSVHLIIAETYKTVASPKADKAMHHLKRALKMRDIPTRYKLKVVTFCIHQGMEKDFKFAEHVCEELWQQSTQKEQKDFLLKSLEQLRQKVNKLRKKYRGYMVFNTPFNNISAISWRSVLSVEEIWVLGEIHRPVASHWRTSSHNVVSSTPGHERDSNIQL